MICIECNKKFFPRKRADLSRCKFCSTKCREDNWKAKNHERILKIQRKSKKKHKEKHSKYNREYYQANKDKFRERHRKLYLKNREKEIHRVIMRRKRVRNLGTFTLEEWEQIKKKFDFTCPHCHRRESEIKLTRDHIIPITKNGLNIASNIQPLCLSCNVRKFNHYPFYAKIS